MEEFATKLVKLKAMDVITLGKLMGVSMVNEDCAHKDGEVIISDILAAFGSMNRKERRTIMKIVDATLRRYV